LLNARLSRPAARYHSRNIVMLLGRTELTDIVYQGAEQCMRWQVSMHIQRLDHALFSEFFSGGIPGFGYAIGVKRESITGGETTLVGNAVELIE
jgi:hypothetical protein